MRVLLAVIATALCAGACFVGRASVGERESSAGGPYNSGYLAGREAALTAALLNALTLTREVEVSSSADCEADRRSAGDGVSY